jgi:hypothetical protein
VHFIKTYAIGGGIAATYYVENASNLQCRDVEARVVTAEYLAAEIIFQKKRERRRRLAALPFEKKIEIVVELQKAAGAIRKDPRHIVWPI